MMLVILGQLDIGSVGLAGVLLGVLGLGFVVVLTIANAKLKVERDSAVEAIEAVLPGANCGGCGLAGCSAYAEAVVKDHGLMGRCGPGGEGLVREIGAILGIEALALAPVRPIVHCSAHTGDKIALSRYYGSVSCGEAQTVAGAMGCSYGCFGGGDCGTVCEFDAMHMVDGLATVDYKKCVGCGACVKACPRQLIEMVTLKEDPLLVVACASKDKGKDVRGYCKVGCIGCGLCAKMAPDVFGVAESLAVIDYEAYASGEDVDKAVGKCPRAMLVYVGTKAAERAEQKEQEVMSK